MNNIKKIQELKNSNEKINKLLKNIDLNKGYLSAEDKEEILGRLCWLEEYEEVEVFTMDWLEEYHEEIGFSNLLWIFEDIQEDGRISNIDIIIFDDVHYHGYILDTIQGLFDMLNMLNSII